MRPLKELKEKKTNYGILYSLPRNITAQATLMLLDKLTKNRNLQGDAVAIEIFPENKILNGMFKYQIRAEIQHYEDNGKYVGIIIPPDHPYLIPMSNLEKGILNIHHSIDGLLSAAGNSLSRLPPDEGTPCCTRDPASSYPL